MVAATTHLESACVSSAGDGSTATASSRTANARDKGRRGRAVTAAASAADAEVVFHVLDVLERRSVVRVGDMMGLQRHGAFRAKHYNHVALRAVDCIRVDGGCKGGGDGGGKLDAGAIGFRPTFSTAHIPIEPIPKG